MKELKMINKNKISAFVITKNEEKNIARCLKSLDFCDEILVVDQGSTDKTLEIAKKYATEIIKDKNYGYCEPSRALAAKKCAGPWLLNLDADEEITTGLRKEILEAVTSKEYDVYEIHRKFFFAGKYLKHIFKKDYVLRLHKKNAIKYNPRIHYGLITTKGVKIQKMHNSMNHYALNSINQLREKIDRYTTIQAKTNPAYNKFPGKYLGIFYRPLGYFCYYYIYKKGFLDGKEGFIYSYMALYHELLLYKKVWFK
jgi:(heptosyl)LPS beta-1,4-glucosyltransferase